MAFVQNILFPYDFSLAAQRAAVFVRDVAARAGARVTVLSVASPGEEKEEIAKRLGAVLHRELHDVPVARVVETGDPAARIVEYAVRLRAHLVMMPTHGQGLSHSLLIGSVTAQVLRDAPCPVWTAHLDNGLFPHAGGIVCLEDGARDHWNACNWARGFGAAIGAGVTPVLAANRAAEDVVTSLANDAGDASAIVVGRGPEPERTERLRSHIYALIHKAHCPVIGV